MLPSTEGVTRWCCLMPHSTIFQLIMAVSFIDWRNLVKTTDLPQVTDKLYHICCIEYTSQLLGFEHTTLGVIDTDCTGYCKSN